MSGVAGIVACVSWCIASMGTATVVNFGCLGSGPYILSMSVVSPSASVFPVADVRVVGVWVY